MAVNDPLFRRKFPLLVGGGLLALHVISAPEVLAAEQFDCQPDLNSGSWACSAQPTTSSVARPEPIAPVAAMPAEASTDSTVKPRKAKAAVVAAQKSVQPTDYAYLDWVPRDQLTEDQLAEIGPYCSGSYIEPYRPGVDLDKVGNDEPTFISAEASRYDQNTEIAYLAGDVVLRQGTMQAEANEASFDQKDNVGELSGNVRLRDQGTLLVGDRAELVLDTGEAKIEDAEYVIHQQRIRGSARYAKREQDAIVRLKDGTYTSCAPGSNAWQLRGNNITLNPNTGFGSATNVVLKVKDIPVFYTPYIYFPIDDRRQSGFLPPSISTSSKNGTSLVTPYYFNLAPNFDATLYPNYMSKRGLLTEGEFRYLTRNSEGQFGGAWIKDHGKDRKWINTVPGEDLSKAPDSKDTRWMYSWQNTTGFDSRWISTVDYTDISDPYYFQDFDTNLAIDTPDFLHQDAGVAYRGNNYVARLNLQAYERATIVDVTPYERLPQLTLDGRVPGEWNGLQFAYSTEYVNFQRSLRNGDSGFYDSRVHGLNRAEGERIYLEPTVSLPMDWSWGYLTPKVKYSYTHYDLTLDGKGKRDVAGHFKRTPDRSLPIATLDGGLYFDRKAQWFGNEYRQTLEPRLMYLYVPQENQKDIPVFDTSETSFSYDSLWRDNRFTGRDRIGDANQLSVGLTQRWIEPNGFERQVLSIGQAFYFKDREVQLPGVTDRKESKEKSSPYALAYQYRYNQDWRFSSTFNWDKHTSSTRSGSAMFHYQPADNPDKIVNLGYRYRDDMVRYDPASGKWQVGGGDWGTPGDPNYIKDYYKISQHDFSFIWPIVSQWNAIGSWQYDYNRNRTLDAFGGFEYNSCCWKLRLISRYWIDYDEVSYNPSLNDKGDRGIFLQVVLKGLGGVFGNKTESFLDQGIQGYREREDQAF